MPNHLQNPIFHDEDAARAWFEARIWPDGPFCPHCGEAANITRLHGDGGVKGTKHRSGCFQCNSCREQFTVTVNTVCERSKIPLTKWCLAIYLLNSSKKGMSALQLHRTIGGSYKTAWFMCHRIREAMNQGTMLPNGLGGENKVVEVDETYVGGKEKNKHASKRKHAGRGAVGKAPIVSLVERDGSVRSFHVPHVSATTLRPIIVTQVNRASFLMTDESTVYPSIGAEFSDHGTVTARASTFALSSGTQTRSKIAFRSSNAASSASTIMSARRICTDTLPSLIPATTTDLG